MPPCSVGAAATSRLGPAGGKRLWGAMLASGLPVSAFSTARPWPPVRDRWVCARLSASRAPPRASQLRPSPDARANARGGDVAGFEALQQGDTRQAVEGGYHIKRSGRPAIRSADSFSLVKVSKGVLRRRPPERGAMRRDVVVVSVVSWPRNSGDHKGLE